ncbi:MAG TPA: RidA family protein [Phenylobacterium sp.]|nr:RidA family protein [Phenylobacterium sp.]
MKILHNPAGAPATYSDGVEVPAGGRTLFVAGQVGWTAAKAIPEGIEEQTRLLFANLAAVLRSADMGFADIVKTTVYIVNPEDYPAFGKVRSAILGDVRPASTLVFVKALILPELLVEVEAIAVSGP